MLANSFTKTQSIDNPKCNQELSKIWYKRDKFEKQTKTRSKSDLRRDMRENKSENWSKIV